VSLYKSFMFYIAKMKICGKSNNNNDWFSTTRALTNI